ncbi:hypothetical protein D3C84_593250 [compost metagenome]
MADVVPVRHAPGLDVPVGDHVIAPLQHPVERPGVRHQAVARVGIDQLLDQLVDGRVPEADVVAAAGLVGAFRFPELALFVTR